MNYENDLVGIKETFDLLFSQLNLLKISLAKLNLRVEKLETFHKINTTPDLSLVSTPETDDIEMKDNEEKLKVGYFCEWDIYQRKFNISDIPADKLTHLLYAFMLPNVSETDIKAMKLDFPPKPDHFKEPLYKLVAHDQYAFDKNMKELKLLKEKHPHLKTMISIGGWTLSGWFSKIFANKDWRQILILSIKNILEKYDFDGIDIDWEYPNNEGRGNNYKSTDDNLYFQMFMKELDYILDNEYLISVALPIDRKKMNEFKGIGDYCDFISLMAYDMSGSWDTYKSHQSSLYDSHHNHFEEYNCDSGLKRAVELGIPKNKLLLGIPLYYRSWGKTLSTEGDNEDGYTSYRHIINKKENKTYYYKSDFSKDFYTISAYTDYDKLMTYRGNNGSLTISNNEAKLSGEEPRIYINGTWRDIQVEYTFKQVSADGKNWSGSCVGVRSDIEGHATKPELAHTIYFRMRRDQSLDFYLELNHNDNSEASRRVVKSKKYSWDLNTEYDIKFKVYNSNPYITKLEGYINDKLELYYDLDNQDIYNANGVVLIRNSFVNDARYKNIRISNPTFNKELTYNWDDVAKAPYYTSEDGDLFVGDDVKSVELKCKYINENGYAGCMFWCISDDVRDFDSDLSLINTIHKNL